MCEFICPEMRALLFCKPEVPSDVNYVGRVLGQYFEINEPLIASIRRANIILRTGHHCIGLHCS